MKILITEQQTKSIINETYYSEDANNWIKNNVDVSNIIISDINNLIPIIDQTNNSNPNINIPIIVDQDNLFIEDGNHRYFFAKKHNINK